MKQTALQALKTEAKTIYDRGEMTLVKYQDILHRASEHCKLFPSALAGFFQYAPREWVEQIKRPALE